MGLGQFRGARGNYEFTADDGSLYLISTDRTLGDISGAKLVLATSGSDAVSPPKRFRPRIVYWQGELNSKIVRKKIICDIDSTLYKNNKSVSLEIDNVDGFTTGRRGEKFSYLKLSQDENGIIPGDGVS